MSEVLYNTKFLQLKSTPSKSGSQWYYAHRPNADDVVVILPVYKDEIMFIIEDRPPMTAEGKGKYTIGVPAGLVGDERIGESVEEAIKAELKEEAGLIAESIDIKAKKVAASSGCISETCVLAIAHVKSKTPAFNPIDDGGIIVDRLWVKKSELLNWINKCDKEGYVISAHTLALLFYLLSEDKLC